MLFCGCLCSESLSNSTIQCDDTSLSTLIVVIDVLSSFILVRDLLLFVMCSCCFVAVCVLSLCPTVQYNVMIRP